MQILTWTASRRSRRLERSRDPHRLGSESGAALEGCVPLPEVIPFSGHSPVAPVQGARIRDGLFWGERITPVLGVCRYWDRSHFEATAAVCITSEGFRLEFPSAWTVATDFLPVLDPSPTFGNHAFRITASINRLNHARMIVLEFCTLILNSWI